MAKQITILATSDLHGYIYPYNYANGKEAFYGLARLKTLVDQLKDENKIIADIVKTTCGYSVNVMQNIENVLSELNDNKEHRFQKELDFLRSARQQKSENKVNIERINDIHGNSTVNIGSK